MFILNGKRQDKRLTEIYVPPDILTLICG